jgi:TatD DNase family protein
LALFDTHCHLDLELFDADRDDVYARAHAAQVTRFLNPAFDLASSGRAARLATMREDTWAAVGIHPNAANEVDDAALTALRGLASHPRVVAIGEIGLDYHWNSFPAAVARAAFQRQIELARELGKPIIIHCRDAMVDVLDTLAEADRGPDASPVLLHAFSGDAGQARLAVERGYTIGLGGPLTYKRAEDLRAIARSISLQSIVLETDSPYLAPHPFRGRRNEPCHVADVAALLATLRGVDPELVAETTTANALRLFNIRSTPHQS